MLVTCDRISIMNRTQYLTDMSDAEWNCIAPFFLLPLFMVDLASTANVRSSMPFSICCEADARGVCFPTTCLHGKRCTTTFVCGRTMVSGNGFIQPCASKHVKR